MLLYLKFLAPFMFLSHYFRRRGASALSNVSLLRSGSLVAGSRQQHAPPPPGAPPKSEDIPIDLHNKERGSTDRAASEDPSPSPPLPPPGNASDGTAAASEEKHAKLRRGAPKGAPTASEAAARFGRAVLDRDFQAAGRVVEQSWRDEYVVPVVCLLAAIMVYYTTSISRRSAQRRCEAAEARCKEELQLLREQLTGLLDKWESELTRRESEIERIQKENMELTRSVDQMTFALKQCAPSAAWPTE